MAANAPGTKQGFSGRIFGSLTSFYHRRWLVKYFVQRQITRNYQSSFLGFVWAFLGPLLMVAVLTLVFSEIVGLRAFREVEGTNNLNFGLYLYCGLLPFLAYSEALSKGATSIRSSSGLVQKVVFPLEFLPFTMAVTALIDKIFALVPLMAILLIAGQGPHWVTLLLPLVMISQLFFMLGLSYLMAVLGTFVPDVNEVLRAVVRATFFITPIIWPVSRIEGKETLSLIVDLNPLAYLVGAYRDLIIMGEIPGLLASLYFTLFSLAIFALGFGLFARVKTRFADLI